MFAHKNKFLCLTSMEIGCFFVFFCSVATVGGNPLNKLILRTGEALHKTKEKRMSSLEVEWSGSRQVSKIKASRTSGWICWDLRAFLISEGSAEAVFVFVRHSLTCYNMWSPFGFTAPLRNPFMPKALRFRCDIGNTFCLEFAHFLSIEMCTTEAWWPEVADCVAFSHTL